jgi:HK97 family phage portal protein
VILRDGRSSPIAPQAFAETRPLFYSGYFVPNTGIQLEKQFATYAQLYKRQPWVATVVNKISNLIARLGVNVWDESKTSGKVLDTTSPYALLLAKPCTTLDPYSFWLWIASTIEIYGEAYLIKMRNAAGKPESLYPMHPAMVQIHRDDEGALKYRFMGRPNELISEKDVIPFRMYDPDGTMRGFSRLEPLRSTLMNEDSARRAQSSWWQNNCRPSFLMSTEKRLGSEGKERLRQAVISTQAGSSNAGGVMVLEDGVTAQQMQLTAEEMQYIEARKLNREEVCAVYDIPPTAVHVLDHATFSNITEQYRSVYRDTMAPRIEFIESGLNWHLGIEFNGVKSARFAVAEVLRGDFEKRAPAAVQLVQSGIMKPAEARPLFDLDDAGAVADKLYANSAIQELGRPAEQIRIQAAESGGVTPDMIPIQAVATLPGGESTTPAKLSAGAQKYVRDIGGAISRGRSIQDAAKVFVDRDPDDIEYIEEACRHIIERNP